MQSTERMERLLREAKGSARLARRNVNAYWIAREGWIAEMQITAQELSAIDAKYPPPPRPEPRQGSSYGDFADVTKNMPRMF